jgi:hypothetical protein
MISSREDALSLLNKWKSEGSMISVLFVGTAEEDQARLWGFVTEVTEDSATVSSAKDAFFSLSVRLVGDNFTYGDPRDALTREQQLALEAKYVCAFSYQLPSGGRCFFAELRM